MAQPSIDSASFRTRIAPTPSGYLHAGNAVNFLITQILANENQGSIWLRIDDLDVERARPEYVQDIFTSLAWLGITWTEGPRTADDLSLKWSQRLRLERPTNMAETLRSAGHLFACTCSRTEMATCTCRSKELPFDTIATAWRLKLPSSCRVALNKWPHGRDRIDLRAVMPDPVIRQRNGSPSYQLTSLADDVAFGMNVIVRGEDLLPSSACQAYMADLLGLEHFLRVRFLHHPLLTDDHGAKLSKSKGADSLQAMQDAGNGPEELRAIAARSLAAAKA
jgi:glutamyl/glutaminyl-tRNA synthetase